MSVKMRVRARWIAESQTLFNGARRRSTFVVCALTALSACGEVPQPTGLGPRDEPLAAKVVGSPVVSIVGLEPLSSAVNVGEATGISDLGQVVGTVSIPAGIIDVTNRAVIWDGSDIPQDLGLLAGGTRARANSISPDGSRIVGGANDATTKQHAVRWTKINGAWTINALPDPVSGIECLATDVASDGTIVGNCAVSGYSHAIVWRNGVATDLGLGVATAVNGVGQLVGETFSVADPSALQAAVWDLRSSPITPAPLGSLSTGTASYANDINDNGDVVGMAKTGPALPFHAFLWTARRGMVDLGTLGGSGSIAYAINNTGQIVGSSPLAGDAVTHAAYWAKGKLFDLGVLAPYDVSFASAINNNGKVAGTSLLTTLSDNLRATIWTLK